MKKLYVILVIFLYALLASSRDYPIEKTEGLNGFPDTLKEAGTFIQDAIDNGKLAGFSALVLKDNQLHQVRIRRGHTHERPW